MSYYPAPLTGDVIFTEFSCTTTSVSNSAFIWDNSSKRSTGSSSVSTSSGNVTLPAGGSYWLMASVDLTRSSTAYAVKAKWTDVNGDDLLGPSGGSKIELDSSVYNSANMIAQVVIDVPQGSSDYVCKLVEFSGNSHTPSTDMTLLIQEVR